MDGGVAVLSGEGRVAVMGGVGGGVAVLGGIDVGIAVLSEMNGGAVDSGFAPSDDTAIGTAGMIVSLCSCWTGSIDREPVTPLLSLDAIP